MNIPDFSSLSLSSLFIENFLWVVGFFILAAFIFNDYFTSLFTSAVSKFIQNTGIFIKLSRILFIDKLAKRIDEKGKFSRFIYDEKTSLTDILDKRYASSENSLAAGRLDESREKVYPKSKYPELYESLRSDMNPGEIISSRLVGGRPILDKADQYVTDDLVNESYKRVRSDALTFACLPVVILFVTSLCLSLSMNVSYYSDSWTTTPSFDLIGYVFYFAVSIAAALLVTVLNPLIWIFGYMLAYLYVAITVPQRTHNAVVRLSDIYTYKVKDAYIGYKYNISARAEDRQQFIRAMNHNKNYLSKKGLDHSIYLGKATGEFRSRGLSEYFAPAKDQDIRLDKEALTTGIAIMGQTGAGKTTSLILPMYRQLVGWKEAGFFIMDSKAVLWKDCRDVTAKYAPERLNDFVVVGTEDKDYGVDLLEGLTPNQVADGVRSVFDQIAGDSSGDDYWPSAATYLLMHAARLAQAYELTEEGISHFESTGERPYSLYFIYNLIRDNAKCDQVAKAIMLEMREGTVGGKLIEDMDSTGILETIDYLTNETSANPEAIRKMSDGQKSGVVGSVTKIMGQLGAIKVLREKFARGRRDHVIDVDQAMNSKIVAANISKEETGIAGQLIMTFLKNRLYQAATIRQAHMKLHDLGNPQDKPIFFICDEFQNFVSSSKTVGISDGNAFNTLRSTGLTGILAFQNFSSIIRVLGEKVANDFLAQMITKIILVNQDDETRRFAAATSGKTIRMRTHRNSEHENYWQLISEKGYPISPEELDKNLRNDFDHLTSGNFVSGRPLPHLHEKEIYRSPELEHLIDSVPSSMTNKEFLGSLFGMAGSSDSSAAISRIGMRADYQKRKEDLEAQYMTSGNELVNIIDEAEISRLPRWKAWISYPQAGLMKSDFIELTESIH